MSQAMNFVLPCYTCCLQPELASYIATSLFCFCFVLKQMMLTLTHGLHLPLTHGLHLPLTHGLHLPLTHGLHLPLTHGLHLPLTHGLHLPLSHGLHLPLTHGLCCGFYNNYLIALTFSRINFSNYSYQIQ